FPDGSTMATAAATPGNYIQNGTSQQPSSNFNISGNGVIGTNLNVAGNVGVGVPNPAQKLSVAGTIESTSGGFKFPNGMVQDGAVGTTYTTTNHLQLPPAPPGAPLTPVNHLNLPNSTYLVDATIEVTNFNTDPFQ